jgi:hypothetical protein
MGSGLYIVDYDIPEEPARERIQFYRDMKVLQNRYSEDYSDYSTRSVFRTCSKILACAVFLLVTAHGGHGHVYCGIKITDQLEITDVI